MLGETPSTTRSPGTRSPRSSTGCPGATRSASSCSARPDDHVGPPHANTLDRSRVEAEHGHAAHALRAARTARHAEHRVRSASLACELGEAAFGSHVEDTDEVLEVLAHDDVERHLERRLVALPLRERRPIPLREECEREGDGQEGDRRNSAARAARKPDRSQSSRERRPLPLGPPARDRREDARDADRRHDREETGQQEEQQRRPLPARKPIFVGGAARKRDRGHEQRSDRHEIDALEACAFASRQRDGDPHEHGGGDRRRPRERQPARREDALAEHVVDRSASEARREPTDGDPEQPADQDACDRDAGALDAAEEPQLPTPCAEPREPASCLLEIAPHPASGKHGEGEKERRALAADEEQARPRDVRSALRCAQLLHRRVDVEGGGARRQLGACTFGVAHESVDVPQARPAGIDRPDPGVGPIGARERRRDLQRGPPLRHDERARDRPVIAARLSERGREDRVRGRSVRRAQEVAVQLRRAKRAGSDLHEAQARRIRQPAATTEPQHLAASGRTRAREATRTQDDVRADPVDPRDPDEPAGHGAFAEEHEWRGTVEPEPGECVLDVTIEHGEPLARVTGDPEPHGSNRPRRRGDALDRLRGRAIGRDRDARQHAGEHRRRHREAEHRDRRAAVASPEATPGEPDDEQRRSHDTRLRRRLYAAVFARLPQIDIEHQVDEPLREAS